MARIAELEQRFSELESQLQASPEREALSILHALVHEGWRRDQQTAAGGQAQPGAGKQGSNGSGSEFERVASLYKTAPPMEGKAENQGLPVGTAAPDFTLLDANARSISLADFRGHNLVLVFYPLDWSPACSDQLTLYQGELEEFKQQDARVVAISVDSIYSHGAWTAVRNLTIPLLADFHPKGEIARRYKVWRESDGFSERAIYVVDRGGIIRYAHVSPELHKVPDIYELFDQLEAVNKAAAGSQKAVAG